MTVAKLKKQELSTIARVKALDIYFAEAQKSTKRALCGIYK